MRTFFLILLITQMFESSAAAMRTSRYDAPEGGDRKDPPKIASPRTSELSSSPKTPTTPRTPRTPRSSLVEADRASLRRSASSQIEVDPLFPPLLAQTVFSDDIRALNLSPRAAPFLIWGLKDLTLFVPSIDVSTLVDYFGSLWEGDKKSLAVSPNGCAKTMVFYKGSAYVLCEASTYVFDRDKKQFHVADGFSIASMQDGFVYAHDGESILRFEDRFGQLVESHHLGFISSMQEAEHGVMVESAQCQGESIYLQKWAYTSEILAPLEGKAVKLINPHWSRQLTFMFVNANHIIVHDGHWVIIIETSSGKTLHSYFLKNISSFVVRHGRLITRCLVIQVLGENHLKTITQEFTLTLDNELSMALIQPELESETLKFVGFSQALANCNRIIHAAQVGQNLYLLQECESVLYLRQINTRYGVEYAPIKHATKGHRNDDYFIQVHTDAAATVIYRGLIP